MNRTARPPPSWPVSFKSLNWNARWFRVRIRFMSELTSRDSSHFSYGTLKPLSVDKAQLYRPLFYLFPPLSDVSFLSNEHIFANLCLSLRKAFKENVFNNAFETFSIRNNDLTGLYFILIHYGIKTKYTLL